MKKIVQVAVAMAMGEGNVMKIVVAIDEDGRAYELIGLDSANTRRWHPLPPLPEDKK